MGHPRLLWRRLHDWNMDFAYLLMNLPYGVPYTVDQAYPFVREAKVMMGFPDMLYGPDDAFALADRNAV